ncbi:MAG: hypothetical protein U0441_05750 [Polyangiaceae bacterium]
MKRELAGQIVSRVHKVTAEIDDTIALVQKECGEEEFRAYRSAAGHAMGHLFADILRPIFQEYPELMPEEMK